jgi:hypothetical protein
VVKVSKIDDFKSFVKNKPELISYVRNGDMTWQKFYEIWDIYGTDSEEWQKYKPTEDSSKKANTTSDNATRSTDTKEAFGINDLFNMFKKIDLNSVKNNISGIQKAIGLIQDMTNKTGADAGATAAKSAYTPRPIFRRFED